MTGTAPVDVLRVANRIGDLEANSDQEVIKAVSVNAVIAAAAEGTEGPEELRVVQDGRLVHQLRAPFLA